MVHDLAVLGATVAGLTAARRLASEGFDVVVIDPGPEASSAAVGSGAATLAQSSTISSLAASYGEEAARELLRRNGAGLDEIRRVLMAGAVPHDVLPLHDHSLGAALERELQPVVDIMRSAGADVRLLDAAERRQSGPGVLAEAIVVDPWAYAGALIEQTRNAGAKVLHDETVTQLLRRDGVTWIAHRNNSVWADGLHATRATAVIDTLGVSPWGQMAGRGAPQQLARVRYRPATAPDVVTLTAGPPVWLTRPDGEEAVALGQKTSGERIEQATDELARWVEAQGGTGLRRGSLLIDPSDAGRPVVGASAIPGGFYARGNGRAELMNGTASGTYLAALLLGSVRGAGDVALPWTAQWRARVREFGRRLRRR